MTVTSDIAAQWSAIEQVAAAADEAIAGLSATNEQLQQENADLTGQLAVAPKPTLFGATPEVTDTAAGFAAMDAKYGVVSPVVRQFCTGVAVTPPASLAGRAVIGSWNTRGSGDAAYMAACKRSFFIHEIDHQWMQKTSTAAKDAYLTQFIADMNALHVLDKTGSLGVCFTDDALINKAKFPMVEAILASCPWLNHIGWDVDGISNTTSYHPYDKELAALKAFLATHPQITSWGVPEFGANRASNDPTGVVRAAWMAKYTGELAAMAAEYLTFWSRTAQGGSDYDTPAEIAVLQTRFQS